MPGGGLSSWLPISYVLKHFISRVLSYSSCHAELYCIASVAAHIAVTFHCDSPYFHYQMYSGTNFIAVGMVKFSESYGIFL